MCILDGTLYIKTRLNEPDYFALEGSLALAAQPFGAAAILDLADIGESSDEAHSACRRRGVDGGPPWEGDTLVVDTTNFTDKTTFQGSSAALHVVERFKRVSADRILYQFTVDDPTTWTRPWSAEIPMMQTEGPLYEYACHEGNYGLANSPTALPAPSTASRHLLRGTIHRASGV